VIGAAALLVLAARFGQWPAGAASAAPLGRDPSPGSVDPDGVAAGPAPVEPAGLQLPDLRTLPPSDLVIEPLSRGRRELRLANTVWNSGLGRLELQGELNLVTQRTRVRQRVYGEEGVALERMVGEFVWHPAHDHWHMSDFAVYELWSLTPHGELDRVVASGAKLSYCLIDTDAIRPGHPGFDPRRRYGGCGRALQGLSIGWGDKYDSFLDGQSIDVTGLSDGLYGLKSTANPDGILLEADYANNTAVTYLRLSGADVAVVPSPELDQARCRVDGWC
jgi:hypothetical protein